jgi:hypothetical protein
MTARRHSPVTGANWQGTGVIPDAPVLADEAYHVVYARALRHVVELGDVPHPSPTRSAMRVPPFPG